METAYGMQVEQEDHPTGSTSVPLERQTNGNFYDLTTASVRGPERTDPNESRRET